MGEENRMGNIFITNEECIKNLIRNKGIFIGDTMGIDGYTQEGKVVNIYRDSIVVDNGEKAYKISYSLDGHELNIFKKNETET
jgi:hypothetical protein